MSTDLYFFLLLAAVFALLGLVVQVGKLMRRRKTVNLAPHKSDASYGVYYAFTKGMLPWNKATSRTYAVGFCLGAVFHAGIVCALIILFHRMVLGVPDPSLSLALASIALGVQLSVQSVY